MQDDGEQRLNESFNTENLTGNKLDTYITMALKLAQKTKFFLNPIENPELTFLKRPAINTSRRLGND